MRNGHELSLQLDMAGYDCSSCFTASLSRHRQPFKAAFMSAAALRAPGGCDILRSGSALFPLSYMYFCFPVAFLQAPCSKSNLRSRRKQLDWGFISLCLSPFPTPLSLPALSSQGLVLVLIKAVSFSLLPAFSTASCELKGNTDTEWRGEKVVTKSRGQRKWARGYTATIQPVRRSIQPASPGQMPGIESYYGTVGCFLPLQSFSTIRPALLLRLLLPPSCCGVWFEGVLGGEASLLSGWV